MFLPFTNITTALASVGLPVMHPTGLASRSAMPVPPYPLTNSTVNTFPANLTISTNGECSGSQTCIGSTFGESCSEWGYCGPSNDTAYSGAGCQSMFGICSSSNSTSSGNSSTSAVPTIGNATITSSVSQSTANSSSMVSSTPVTSTTASSTSASTSASSSTTSSSSASTPASAPSYSYAPTSSTAAAPSASPSGKSGSNQPSDQYTQFVGTGSPSEGWPEQSAWTPFETLFEMNRQIMSDSCTQWNVPNDSDSEINDIKSAILAVASSSSIDARFILAITLQESNGCLRAPKTTSVDGIVNPGLLQTFQGSAMCNSGSATAPADVKTPCPASTIHDMISQGTMGTTPGGMSLKYALDKSGATDVSKYYKAARIYNSGSIASSGLLQDGVATHCYSSDIVNRLLGWSLGPSKCTLNAS
ncbi:hypothetical protein PRZ48_004197 [Zasmidium cellare]|uniref:Uncharacterized protein n=1 Tax=Zasmidium cellare TaxID=395010 RepID=A0ABR0EX87_ZASCE|nr:hypothetical protein PRZ48_004197 [Zasmidium cellare]